MLILFFGVIPLVECSRSQNALPVACNIAINTTARIASSLISLGCGSVGLVVRGSRSGNTSTGSWMMLIQVLDCSVDVDFEDCVRHLGLAAMSANGLFGDSREDEAGIDVLVGSEPRVEFLDEAKAQWYCLAEVEEEKPRFLNSCSKSKSNRECEETARKLGLGGSASPII